MTKIYVNGGVMYTDQKELSYFDVVTLAHPAFKFEGVLTVTYAHAHDDRSGSMIPGSFVKVADGTVFNATDTSRA